MSQGGFDRCGLEWGVGPADWGLVGVGGGWGLRVDG